MWLDKTIIVDLLQFIPALQVVPVSFYSGATRGSRHIWGLYFSINELFLGLKLFS